MEINGKNVTGIFKYSEDSIYNSGDFVILEDNIYICIKDGSIGCNPNENLDKFKPYTYQEEATWEEFEELYSLGSSNKDGIITSRMLSKVLKKLVFGIDINGMITEEITKNYISPGLEEFTNNNINTLDQLILDTKNTELNNLTIKVSRQLPGCLITEKPENIEDTDFKSVLLKQYTYSESMDNGVDGKITYRIQELIDHVFGICFYRYVRLSDYTREGEISSWKQSNVTRDYINKLTNFYEILNLNKSTDNTNRFKFRRIEVSNPYISGTDYQYSVDLGNVDVVTVTITSPINTNNTNSILESYSMTVRVDGNEYKFPNDIKIRCSEKSITLNATANANFSITDIYTRDYQK